MQTQSTEKQSGQGLVEYALILVILAVGLVVALNALGSGVIGGYYNNIISIL